MKFDAFLYGRTRTHDYTDMYIPSWLTYSSKYYSEYRKIVSNIFNIRDHIPENKAAILGDTGNSFIFYFGREICVFCRCCHKSGEDEFGRSIFSTEGFLCRTEDQKDFWLNIPHMMAFMLSSEKNLYEEYMENYNEDEKPVSLEKTESIKKYNEKEIADLIYNAGIEKQYADFSAEVAYRVLPFGFIISKHEKSLFDYPYLQDQKDARMFFTYDNSDKSSSELFWKNKYRPLNIKTETKKFFTYLDISHTAQNRLRYRLVVGNQPDAEGRVSDIPFVSYEKEDGLTIHISDLDIMFRTVSAYITKEEYSEFPTNKYIFEKW